MRTNKTRAGIMTVAGAGVAALALTGFALPANAADGDISADTTSVSEQTSTWNDLGLDDFMGSIQDAIDANDNALIEGPLVSDSLNGAVGSGNDAPIGSGNDVSAPIGSGNDTSVDAPVGSGNEVGNGNETGNGNNVGSGNDTSVADTDTSVGDIGAEVGDVVGDVTSDVDDVVSDVTSDLDSTLNGIFE